MTERLMSRPLQNRVRPDGTLVATKSRGEVFGNRGGRIHDDAQRIVRNWASKQWICCVMSFKGRQRAVMGDGYTELFFLDEATAFAAGHRPCFECRRKDAVQFAQLWGAVRGQANRARAPDMDKELHAQRLGPRRHAKFDTLPHGAICRADEKFLIRTDRGPALWSFEGYAAAEEPQGEVEVLTPQAICDILKNGYQPLLHVSILALGL